MEQQSSFPTVTIAEAKSIISAMAHKQSILLLSAPGVGKSDAVRQAAQSAGLECKSLLGTQIAPEDVSGIPRIIGERSVFCPPRVLLPETPEKFCLFLDELPACSPDIQKAFYSLLLERRIGEHRLPEGTWVVAAGNRAEDRSLVRSLSAALVNRTIILHVRVDVHEWVQWALSSGIRQEIINFILLYPEALQRTVPNLPVPFSTPRAWASLSQALELLEKAGALNDHSAEVTAFGTVSAEDAALFLASRNFIPGIEHSIMDCMLDPSLLPKADYSTPDSMMPRFAILKQIHDIIAASGKNGIFSGFTPEKCNLFLQALQEDEKVMVMLGCVQRWSDLGADPTLIQLFYDITGIRIC